MDFLNHCMYARLLHPCIVWWGLCKVAVVVLRLKGVFALTLSQEAFRHGLLVQGPRIRTLMQSQGAHLVLQMCTPNEYPLFRLLLSECKLQYTSLLWPPYFSNNFCFDNQLNTKNLHLA